MKKSLLLIAVVVAVFGCMAMTSCDDDEKRGEIPIPPPGKATDDTLGGSILIVSDRIYAEGTYDDLPLDDFDEMYSFLNVYKYSDEEIYMSCGTKWGDMRCDFSIPILSLSGVPYDVTFDNSHANATVEINDTEYTNVDSSIKGWIREIDPATYSVETRMSPPLPPLYYYEINFECTVDGKILQLKITDERRLL